MEEQRVYSATHLAAAGFEYTGYGDTARCKHCGLEVSNWTLDMDPLNIHWEKKPDCSYTQSFVASALLGVLSYSSTPVQKSSVLNEYENFSTRQQIETIISGSLSNILVETDSIQQVRSRTFSHWPHQTTLSSVKMIEAGFFKCSVRDRVICIYCNLICQMWKSHTDDPWEVHKTLSPNCRYVQAKMIRFVTAAIPIINGNSGEETSGNHSSITAYNELLQSNLFVSTAAYHRAYAEIPKRHASFATWSNANSPSVDDMARAGFFYTGENDIVTCFYCNGSLQNLNQYNTPMITHARLFPNCAYAKQLCGDEKYHKIQDYRTKQERARANEAREKANSSAVTAVTKTSSTAARGQSSTPDEDILSKRVADRLNLPMSQRMLDENFSPSIIKKCWEDQLRLKEVDFASEADLSMAYLILQKQIEHVVSKKENIIPSKKMMEIKMQSLRMDELTSINFDIIMSIVSLSLTIEYTPFQSSVRPVSPLNSQNETEMTVDDHEQSSNFCVLCFKEEKKLACMPCGHMTTCLPCKHFLRSCPMCHQKIQAFVRIYI